MAVPLSPSLKLLLCYIFTIISKTLWSYEHIFHFCLQMPVIPTSPSSAPAMVIAFPSNIYAMVHPIAPTDTTRTCVSARRVSHHPSHWGLWIANWTGILIDLAINNLVKRALFMCRLLRNGNSRWWELWPKLQDISQHIHGLKWIL